MKCKSPNKRAAGLPLLLVGLGLATSAAAQTELNVDRLATPQTRIYSCANVDINWNLELINQYPRIHEACHEVVNNNGTKWARFEADFVRINRDGTVTSDFIGPLGRPMGRYTLIPGPDQKVTLSGSEYPFSALRSGQRINLYVPEGAFGLATIPNAPVEQQARITRYEEVAVEPAYIAQADPAPAPYVRQLPSTAGPLPWLALGGTLSLLGALGLRIGRNRS